MILQLRNFFLYAGLAMFLVAVGNGRGAVPPTQEARLLLHVPFDGSLDAAVAGGEATGQLGGLKEGGPTAAEFGPGIRGQALEIGKYDYEVRYATAGNVRPERGTLTFWVRRVGEPPDAPYTFHYLGWDQPDGTWVWLYNWTWNPLMALHGRGGSGDVGVVFPDRDDDGQWHLLGLTWDGRRVRAYFDGDPAGGQSGEIEDFPLTGFQSLWVGRGGAGVSRLLDDLRVFDQPLSPAEMKRLYREVVGPDQPPYLVIPPRTTPITLDGRIADEEWSQAAQTTGFIDRAQLLIGPTPTRAWLAYDSEFLYLALSSALPEPVREQYATTIGMTGILKQDRTGFDTDVDADDAMEVLVRPQGPKGSWHRLVVNGLNTHYDYRITPEGNIQLDWNPPWESKSTLDAEGWHVEMRLPFAAFGGPAPQPGDEWELNLARHWQLLQMGQEAWAVGGPRDTTPVRFGGPQEPFVRLSDLGRLSDAALDLRAEVVNPAPQPASVQVTVRTDSPELAHEETLDVPAGGRAPLRLTQRLQDPSTSLVTIEVRSVGAGVPPSPEVGAGVSPSPLFRAAVPLTIRQLLEILTAHYPTAGIYRVTFDAGRLRGTPLAELAGRVEIVDAAGAVRAQGAVEPLPGYRADVEIDVSALPPGSYQARCALHRKEEVIAEKAVAYEKQPLPEWYGNRIGITDQAPKPFTPVTRQGDTLGVWGREYRYDHRLFPVQITTQGAEILAGPVELIAVDGTGQAHSSAGVEAEATWGRHTDMRLEFERSARLGPVSVRTASWLECDGLLWTTLTLPPQDAEIHRLTLRLPLRKEWSEYLNPYDYSTATTGRLARVAPPGRPVGSPAWLGNGEGGLQWMAETTATWRLAEGTPAAEVRIEEDGNVLQLTFLDVPTRLTDGFEVAFGLIATPVRPPTPGYRTWATKNVPPDALFPSYQWYWPPGNEFDPRWPGYSHFIGQGDRPDGRGKYTISSGPYLVTETCPTKVPEFQYWGDEWSPSRLGRKGDKCSVGCPSWVDYLVWCYRQLYDRGRFLGLYYDCAPALSDDNHYHGQGRRVGDTWQPTFPLLGAREVAKRMYCMLRELEPERTMILYHLSGQINMAFLSWCDVYVDGENFTSRINKVERDYHRLFPVDAFLAQSRGHNFGLTNYFLDEFSRAKAIETDAEWAAVGSQPVDHLFGLILLHDSTYWMAYGRGYEHTVEVLQRVNFDDRYRMIPYWKQKIVALPENVFATFYCDDVAKRVLLVLLNNTEENRTLRLKLDWAALGLDPRRVKVDDTWAAKATPPQDPALAADVPLCAALARLEGEELVTPVGHANMRLLVLEE